MKLVDAGDLIRQEMAENPEMAARIEAELQKLRIADAIRRARKEAGLSQKQLAEKLNTGQSAIARMERSDYNRISLPTLAKIAVYLNKPLASFFQAQSVS
ncbi:MAG: helix-turn-helix transcriptional regulator [FCB group bacterium]|nr:helix-turn-helix transcriptional regulator [FCB group bacterium]